MSIRTSATSDEQIESLPLHLSATQLPAARHDMPVRSTVYGFNISLLLSLYVILFSWICFLSVQALYEFGADAAVQESFKQLGSQLKIANSCLEKAKVIHETPAKDFIPYVS
jgi:hypothetical protein